MPSSRRSFLATTGSALFGIAVSPRLPALPSFLPHAEHDLVIRGGTLFDGTGAPGRELDLAISGDRIAAIAPRIAERGREEIDARGLAVSPGFIDIHSHGDGNLDDDPRDESVIRQGVTTIVVGQDGSSRATGAPEKSFASYFAALDALHPSPNVAAMVGLGTLRGVVIGDKDRPATADEIARMTSMVEHALADGACGASSGLEYTLALLPRATS